MEFSGHCEQTKRQKERIHAALDQVMSANRYLGGTQTARLEKRLSELTNREFCLCCASGTDALTLSYLALGVRRGCAVFVPAFAFAATAAAAALRGATPVFVDVDDTLTICPQALQEAINQTKKGRLRPAGIVAVDLFGLPADYERIEKIAQQEGLWVLEDAAQSLGAARFDKQAGAFGRMSVLSFSREAPLSCCGKGGAVCTDDIRRAENVDSLRMHGRGFDKYDNRMLGINSRMDMIQAAILLEKWECFVGWELERRREIAQRYTSCLSDAVRTPAVPEDAQPSWTYYAIRLPDTAARDRLRLFLSTKGIPSEVYYPKPLHLQGAFAYLGVRRGEMPASEQASAQALCLPMHPFLTLQDVDFVCAQVREFLTRAV